MGVAMADLEIKNNDEEGYEVLFLPGKRRQWVKTTPVETNNKKKRRFTSFLNDLYFFTEHLTSRMIHCRREDLLRNRDVVNMAPRLVEWCSCNITLMIHPNWKARDQDCCIRFDCCKELVTFSEAEMDFKVTNMVSCTVCDRWLFTKVFLAFVWHGKCKLVHSATHYATSTINALRMFVTTTERLGQERTVSRKYLKRKFPLFVSPVLGLTLPLDLFDPIADFLY